MKQIQIMSKDQKEEKIEKKVTELNEESNKQKSQEEILISQLSEGMQAFEENKIKVFISALTAGMEIGFSYLLIAILYTFLEGKFSKEAIFFIVAFAYPVGFIIVVLGKSVLFTEQTSLLALPVLHKKRKISELLLLWVLLLLAILLAELS